MGKLVIIHFAPLELYPPIQNLLRFLEDKTSTEKITVLTTGSKINLALFDSSKIRIVRLGTSGQKLSVPKRYWNYLYFYLQAFLILIWQRPARVLYFETISSLPAYLYKRFINRKASIFIHYHEYATPLEFQTGMTLIRYFHRYEKWLYPRAAWTSHTNTFRMEKFKQDILPVRLAHESILPNYPPRSWYSEVRADTNGPLKIVYVGAMSLTTMYAKAFAEWVLLQNGRVQWDIYSYNFTADAAGYLKSLNSKWITLSPGLDYYALPALLKKYDVGVILYNGHIPNYIFNAPNKLFEYLACGLDVWFPDVMAGSLPYVTNGTYPKVVAVDFNALHNFDGASTFQKNGMIRKNTVYFCEEVLEGLTDKLFE